MYCYMKFYHKPILSGFFPSLSSFASLPSLHSLSSLPSVPSLTMNRPTHPADLVLPVQ